MHVSWCVRKCRYCDFNSHEAGDGIPEAAHAAGLDDFNLPVIRD
ncbi:MAG: hypothetical protein AB7U81_04015 [Thiohalomonadaceae bacterium]